MEAPFTSAVDVGAQHYRFLPVRLLMRDQFHSDLFIGKVRAPVLVLYWVARRDLPMATSGANRFKDRMLKRPAVPRVLDFERTKV